MATRNGAVLMTGLLAIALVGAASAKSMMSSMDRTFMTKAAQGGIAEVKVSKLALAKTSNPDVRAVAQRLIKEHGQANADLKQVAANEGVTLPKDTDSKHKAAYAKLSRMSGAAFDKAYIAGQVNDHVATVALFQKELAKGQDTAARSFDTKWLSQFQDHTKMIVQVNNKLKTGKKSAMSTTGM